MPRVFETLDEFKAATGEQLGTSDWVTITQEQINTFADATGDHQWIHIDPERAAAGPVRRHDRPRLPDALAAAGLRREHVRDQGLTMGLNYGANKLRFTSPVPVDSRVRATATLSEIADIAIGTQVVISLRDRARGRRQAGLHRRVVYVMAA